MPVRLRAVALAGLLMGALLALVLAAPAAWLGALPASWTQGRLIAQQASGTIWNGQAQLVLGGGPGSRDRLAVPQRLSWRLRPSLGGLSAPAWVLTLQHPTILLQAVELRVAIGWGSARVSLRHADGPGPVRAQMPASWLVGLGSPWNTLEPSGELSIEIERLESTLQLSGPADSDVVLRVQMRNVASRVSTLAVLGHYDLDIRGGPELLARLTSRPGSALQLEGTGWWSPDGRAGFHGLATAASGREEALSNLLNIIGRREGARSRIALGSPSPPGGRVAETK